MRTFLEADIAKSEHATMLPQETITIGGKSYSCYVVRATLDSDKEAHSEFTFWIDKKALVVISDGGDNASHHKRREMLDTVERSLATIYTIGLFDAGDADRDPGILRKLTGVSGGIAYLPDSLQDMTEACRAIAKDIRTRYTVGYAPSASNGGLLRHIRVRVSAPGRTRLSARTRISYRYEETASKSQ